MASIFENPVRPKTGKKPEVAGMYTARLYNSTNTIDMTTQLPERFPIGLATSWDTPFNQPISDYVGGQGAQIVENVARIAKGQTSLNKWMSGAVWTSGSVLEVSEIPFVLTAYSDPKKEVLDPFTNLLKAVAPTEDKYGMLSAPGPHLLGQSARKTGGETIYFEIGSFFKMYPCIIESVQGDFDTQFDQNGYPISATVSVTVKSFWCITRQDIDAIFKG